MSFGMLRAERSRTTVPATKAGAPGAAASPRSPERLLFDFLREACAHTEHGLERCVELLLTHPHVDYALLEAPPAPGGGASLAIERAAQAAPAAARAADGGVGLSASLRERGLASAVSLPAGTVDTGSLTLGSRESGRLEGATLAWCKAAASILGLALDRRRMETEALQAQRAQTAPRSPRRWCTTSTTC